MSDPALDSGDKTSSEGADWSVRLLIWSLLIWSFAGLIEVAIKYNSTNTSFSPDIDVAFKITAASRFFVSATSSILINSGSGFAAGIPVNPTNSQAIPLLFVVVLTVFAASRTAVKDHLRYLLATEALAGIWGAILLIAGICGIASKAIRQSHMTYAIVEAFIQAIVMFVIAIWASKRVPEIKL
jgi:hypothetical protein